MATNDDRFDFETVLGTKGKDWACASDLQNLTRWCLSPHGSLLLWGGGSRAQGQRAY
jgi:hypothetical protein